MHTDRRPCDLVVKYKHVFKHGGGATCEKVSRFFLFSPFKSLNPLIKIADR